MAGDVAPASESNHAFSQAVAVPGDGADLQRKLNPAAGLAGRLKPRHHGNNHTKSAFATPSRTTGAHAAEAAVRGGEREFVWGEAVFVWESRSDFGPLLPRIHPPSGPGQNHPREGCAPGGPGRRRRVRGNRDASDTWRRRWPGAVGNSGIVAYGARSPLWRPSAKHAQVPQFIPVRQTTEQREGCGSCTSRRPLR